MDVSFWTALCPVNVFINKDPTCYEAQLAWKCLFTSFFSAGEFDHIRLDLRLCMHDYYSAPVRVRTAEYCDQPVCLCVCLSVRVHISGTADPIGTKFCMRIPCGRGYVMYFRFCEWHQFGRNGRDAEMWRLTRAATAMNDVAIPGRSLMSMNDCLESEARPVTFGFSGLNAEYTFTQHTADNFRNLQV